MKQLILSVVVAIFVSFILVGCSGENKPPISELEATLAKDIPDYVEIKNFSIEPSQNIGTEVDPIYVSQFKLTLTTMDDLYRKDRYHGGVTFVSVATGEGVKVDIFGKIKSKFYKGAWKNNIDMEGNPWRDIGLPIKQISNGQIILSGSDDEKKHFAEFEKEIEHQKKLRGAFESKDDEKINSEVSHFLKKAFKPRGHGDSK